MTGSFTKIAPDDLTRFKQGDEAALERVFREEYDPLLAVARTELTEPEAAPRLVEGALYDAWKQRERFLSPGDLEFFLRDAIHKEAVRENGRRAALHRFHEHEGGATPHRAVPRQPADVDEAWREFASVLHAPPPDSEHAAHLRRDLSRHEAATHVAHVADERGGVSAVLMAAIALVVVAAIVFGVRTLSARDVNGRIDAALASSDTRDVATPPGRRANIDLADGSRATLGPDSHLRIPPRFGESLRAVGLVGTGSFTVGEADDRPFHVRTGPARITAAGTVFDVSAYTDSVILVRVQDGLVTLSVGDSVRSLTTGDAVVVAADGGLAEPTAQQLEEMLGWTMGEFAAVNRRMRELPPLVQRWYGLQVVLADSALLDRRVTVRAPLDSASVLVAALEAAGRARATSRGAERVFHDAASGTP
ncbi:MAG TPA: FecR domain-containing protein [Gemmatimonadaceae bacterium]|nr:FecR domain-containing protein [Gemmatimonadaceae bacterium]